MCGRTACALDPCSIKHLSRYQTQKGDNVEPVWISGVKKYEPSHNKAPQSYNPVLLHKSHFSDHEAANYHEATDFVLCSMRWGLIPNWFMDDDVNKSSYNMNNARSDTLMEKQSYKIPLRKGQRCVILVEGFYEWNTSSSGSKQPYFIHLNQTPEKDHDSKENTKLLKIAGVFEKTYHKNEDLYSFSVITVDADNSFSSIHHRMPAILETESEMQAWLNHSTVPLQDALKLLRPKSCLKWYPVSKLVNNSRYQDPKCREEIPASDVHKPLSKKKKLPESKTMMKWLTSKKDTSSPPKTTTTPAKKRKQTNSSLDKWMVKKPKR